VTADNGKIFDEVFRRLSSDGVLLLVDSSLPSVATIVSKKKIKGSWWAHEDSHKIFTVSEMLADHPDVLVIKLLSNKVTFVHRELWQTIYSIAVARDEWQLKGLSNDARQLLKRLDQVGFLDTHKLDKPSGTKPGNVARELEARLLLTSQQVHTSSGAHAKLLETWDAWAKRIGYKVRAKDSDAARLYLEQRVLSIENGIRVTLPWSKYFLGVRQPRGAF
jgi:hypothetical protein